MNALKNLVLRGALQDFGAMGSGAFRFSKGTASDFHYKNLSGGEKAAFDMLLDVFIKREEVPDAVYCIDEPELHVATGLQGQLIGSIRDLLPDSAQLWIATHSIGIVREANRIYQNNRNEVTFIDFSSHDFDQPVCIKPSNPNRSFWMNIYDITLDDLSSLVAPRQVVFCEGDVNKHTNGFDARCYNELFKDDHPDTLFISRGGANQVVQSDHLIEILKAVSEGITVIKLIDKDNMSLEERKREINKGIRVLRQRELEDYLYQPNVLRTFLSSKGCEAHIDDILIERERLLTNSEGPPKVKNISQELHRYIGKKTGLTDLGRSREAFALDHLVPALRNTTDVFKQLGQDIFNHENHSEMQSMHG